MFLLAVLALCFTVVPARGETAGRGERYSQAAPDSVLARMFDASAAHSVKVKDYKCELYLKGHLKVHKQNRIIKYLPSMFRLEKGVNDYLYESISDLHYTAPDIIDRKVRALSTTFPNAKGEIFDVINYLHFNIYSPSLMNDRIVSPLNRESRVHYRYSLEDVVFQSGGAVYKIRITPRYKSTQLVEGVIWVSSLDWTIRYIDLSGHYDLVEFQLSMQMGDTEETKYLPMVFNLDLHFRFLRNHLEMRYTGWM